jgi:hypothetical protein
VQVPARSSHDVPSTSTAQNSENTNNTPELPPPLKRFKYLSRKLTSCNNSTEDTDIVCEAVDINTELQYYSAELKKIGVLIANSALQFWLDRHSTYPLLSLLAEDLVSAPASQAYVERIFFGLWGTYCREAEPNKSHSCLASFP